MGLVRCYIVAGSSILFKKCHIGNNVDLSSESISTNPPHDIHVYECDTDMQDTYPVESFNEAGYAGTLLHYCRHFNIIYKMS